MDRERRATLRNAMREAAGKKRNSTGQLAGNIVAAATLGVIIGGIIVAATNHGGRAEAPSDRPASRIPPYVVSLQVLTTAGPAHVCTGELVRRDVVLTAAHCITRPPAEIDRNHSNNSDTCKRKAGATPNTPTAHQYRAAPGLQPRQFVVHVGGASPYSAGEFINVLRMIAQPEFDWSSHGAVASNDIGVVFLARPTTMATPVPLAFTATTVGQPGTGFGWDVHNNDGCGDVLAGLQEADGQVADNALCHRWGMSGVCFDGHGHGLCEGASGGPVVSPDGHGGDQLIGIFSQARPGGCLAGPISFTPIALYRDFINDALKGSST